VHLIDLVKDYVVPFFPSNSNCRNSNEL